MFARAGISSAHRSRSLVQTVVLVLVAFTVLITCSSVKHLAGAIASRHNLARQSSLDVTEADSGAHKRLQHSSDFVDKALPHWVSDGAVQHVQSSVRGIGQPGKQHCPISWLVRETSAAECLHLCSSKERHCASMPTRLLLCTLQAMRQQLQTAH